MPSRAVPRIGALELARMLGTGPFDGPVYRGLADRLRLLVADGQIAGGTRLPSERELGLSLGLSRTTVAAGYALLRERGLLTARRGSGNFVHRSAGPPISAALPMAMLNDPSGTIGLNAAFDAAPAGVAAAYRRAGEQLPALLAGTGYYPDGVPQLRARLADWFSCRGVPTDPGQIVITGGALAAFNVVVRALASPSEPVLVEAPTYYNVIAALVAARQPMIGLPTTASGWEPAELDRLLLRHRPRLAFLITEFHNPTGAWPTDDQREQAAASLRRHDTVGVIDETLLELSLDGKPARRPLASFDAAMITIGSASKAFWGGLRVGWIRAPRSMIESLVIAQASLDLGTPPLEQLVLAELLDDSTELLRRRRELLRQRRDLVVESVAQRLPEWRLTVPAGGLSLWYEFDADVSDLLVAAARQRGLVLTPAQRFYPPGSARRADGSRRLRIPFTAEPDVLLEALDRLRAAWQDVHGGTTRPSTARPSTARFPAADLVV